MKNDRIGTTTVGQLDHKFQITLYYVRIVDYGLSAIARVVSLASMAAGIGTLVNRSDSPNSHVTSV
jgi:hypothetical protein